MRRYRGSGATHRDASLPAGVVKVSVLGALATATIAAPLAAAAAGVDETATAPEAAPAGIAENSVAENASATPEPVALPMAEGTAAAEARTADAAEDASRSEDRSAVPAAAASAAVDAPADDAAADEGEPTEDDAEAAAAAEEGTGISVSVPEPEPEVVDESGAELTASGSGYIQPVNAPITSNYGYRTHPVLGYSKLHAGVDFGAACGTPVHAAQSGTVSAVEYHRSSGKRVKIDHGDGNTTGYYHLQGYNTTEGATVEQGDVIGYVGTTGTSTGCHLHFAKMDASGSYSNPMSLLR